MPKRTMVEALHLALDQNLARDPDVVLLGEDIGVNGGVFRVTKGLQETYGADRVMDTPLAECGIVGTAVGMAIYGMKPVVEIQFSGFTMQAFDQIEQNMARFRSRWCSARRTAAASEPWNTTRNRVRPTGRTRRA